MNFRRTKIAIVALAAPLALGAVGCKNDNSSSSSAPLSAPSPEEVRSIDLPPHSTVTFRGVAPGSVTPPTAFPTLVTNFSDRAATIAAESSAPVPLVALATNGQKFEFSTTTGQAKIDGQPVFQLGHSSGHKYKLYFESEV